MSNPFDEWLGRELDGGRHYDTYPEVLPSERWRWVGSLLRRWHQGRCQICGETRRTQVHHRDYRSLGSEPPRDLLLVCDSCHKALHEGRVDNEWIEREHPEDWDQVLRDVAAQA